MRLYNTLTRTTDEFKPLQEGRVTLYTCGPTVYDFSHIGHIRKYVWDDVLKRSLTFAGYGVDHVMNITDVGHLSSDADSGEDKLEKGAKKYGKTVWEVAQFYTDYFNHSMQAVNVITPDTVCKATDHIPQMIELIQQLEKNGLTYETDQAVYFDVVKYGKYGVLNGQKLEDKKVAARDDVNEDPGKRHPADFALWFKRVGRFADHTMHWDSPWGDGFPGWHIECSAMSMHYLGETIDIHTGGIDHIPVHHENEIAQSEGATGKQFVRWWMHHNFLQVDGAKMSKSLENFYTIDDVTKRGFSPSALRYLMLQTHYRKEMNFTWEALTAAQTALHKLSKIVSLLSPSTTELDPQNPYLVRFREAIEDDLNMAKALAVMWEMLESKDSHKRALFEKFNTVFGLEVEAVAPPAEIPEEVKQLAQERVQARKEKNFTTADMLRLQIEEKGYSVKDVGDGFELIQK